MKIDPSGSGSIGGARNTAQTQTVAGTQTGQRGQTGIDRDQDQVDLSGASSLVALSAGMMSASRQARIDGLTAQVQSGQYQVDAGQVARAMVKSMLRA
ncbi:MAG: flagellar biosynthesis anti-sigma factor FlgM [Bryobacteraceae bacterium]|jgi:flagellar biosynthesis anti-sigma factor FlgM